MIDRFRNQLHHSFLLRWVLANMAGWTIGLFLPTISINSWIFLLLSGVAYGAVVGAAQRHVLRHSPIVQYERWLLYSFLGGICAALLAIVLIIPYLLSGGWLIAVMIGSLVGATLGVWQSFLLRRAAHWWVAANLVGGALCALFTNIQFIRGLPIGLLLGTAAFGYITGRVLDKMQTDQ